MAIKEWSTNYPAAQDTPSTDQQTLVDGVDDTRVSQIHTMRDKLDAACQLVGTSGYPSLPSDSLVDVTRSLVSRERMIYHYDVVYEKTGSGYATAYVGKFFINYNEPPPGYIHCAIRGTSESGGVGHIKVTLTGGLEPWQGVGPILFTATVTDSIHWYYYAQAWGDTMDLGWFSVKIEVEGDLGPTMCSFQGLYLSRID